MSSLMPEQKKPKQVVTWAAAIVSACTLGGMILEHLDKRDLRDGAKSEISVTQEAVSDLAKRFAKFEGAAEQREKLCRCVRKDESISESARIDELERLLEDELVEPMEPRALPPPVRQEHLFEQKPAAKKRAKKYKW